MDTIRVIAKHNRIRHSPYKMRVVANRVKNLSITEAQTQLSMSTKKAAKYIVKVLNAAIANAKHNFGLKEEDLMITELQIGHDHVYKKPKFRARGQRDTTRTNYSKIRLVLEERSKD